MPTPKVKHPTSGLSGTGQAASLRGPTPFAGPTWDLGTVKSYDPITQRYVVDLFSGGQPVNVSRIVDHPGAAGALPVGSVVVVCGGIPRGPYIFGAVQGDAAAMRLPATPWEPGNLAGDLTIRSMGGGVVGVLNSGTAVVAAGPGTGVFANAIKERLDVVGNEIDELTAAGRRGVEVTAAGPNVYWRYSKVEMDVASGGDIIDLRITQPASYDYRGQVQVNEEGLLTLRMEEGFTRVVGNETAEITGDETKVVGGNSSVTITGNLSESAGIVSRSSDSVTDTSGGNRSVATLGNVFTHTSGSTRSVGLSKARYEYGDSIEWVVGDPRNLKFTPGAMQALINYVGDTHVVNVLPGKAFNVVTTGPGTVNLGVPGVAAPNPLGGHFVTPAPGVFSVTKYEPLAALIQTLLTWMDTHIHTATGPAAPTTPPVVPSTPIVSPLVAALQSQTVKVGPL
jgi:hypothetical protein